MRGMKMIRTIEQVSTIISGLPNNAYTDLEIQDGQPVFLMKGNDLNHNGTISLQSMERVYLSDAQKTKHHLLENGDVVLLARGSAIRAGFVTEEIAKAVVIANANYLIVRPLKSEVRGQVIVAYFNSEAGREQLIRLSPGAVIQHIKAANLRSMKIPIPDFSVQNKICELYHASQEAYRATQELAEQQRRTSNTLMLNLMLEAV